MLCNCFWTTQLYHMQVVYDFLWAKVLIFQGSAHQNGVGSLSKRIM